jgi:hypothetical protein
MLVTYTYPVLVYACSLVCFLNPLLFSVNQSLFHYKAAVVPQLLPPFLYHVRYVCGGGTVCPGAVTSTIALVRCSCPSPTVPCPACRKNSPCERCLRALCSVKGRKKYARRRDCTVTYQAAGRHTPHGVCRSAHLRESEDSHYDGQRHRGEQNVCIISQ